MITKIRRARRALVLGTRLARWIVLQRAELTEFEDRYESEAMQGSLDAFEAVRDYLDTGHEPLFITLQAEES
jgi:hypothetical protein